MSGFFPQCLTTVATSDAFHGCARTKASVPFMTYTENETEKSVFMCLAYLLFYRQTNLTFSLKTASSFWIFIIYSDFKMGYQCFYISATQILCICSSVYLKQYATQRNTNLRSLGRPTKCPDFEIFGLNCYHNFV